MTRRHHAPRACVPPLRADLISRVFGSAIRGRMSSFPEANDWRDVGWLDRLARVRAPVEPLNRQIIAHVGETWLGSIGSDNRCLEIGAGDGKLRDWLPPSWLDHVVHSEPRKITAGNFKSSSQR